MKSALSLPRGPMGGEGLRHLKSGKAVPNATPWMVVSSTTYAPCIHIRPDCILTGGLQRQRRLDLTKARNTCRSARCEDGENGETGEQPDESLKSLKVKFGLC
jgi:hypothetical protein